MKLWLAALGLLLLSPIFFVSQADDDALGPLPAFTQNAEKNWINGDPVTLESLRGKPTVVHFWAFECWNCYRSFPWLNELKEKFETQGVQFIGVHSPEFEREKGRDSVIAKARQFELSHPIMLDNDFRYWKSMKNRFWPAYYLVGADGVVRHRFIGETHSGDAQARKIDKALSQLVKDAG